MIQTIETYLLVFLLYAFLGWSMEVICKFIQYKRFINRGFLIGPYCPIYGYGALFITILLKKYIEDPIALFIMAIVICSILEYTTSYVMEKLFSVRWWDYSNKKFNINGRICLETMIPFGLLGLGIMYVTNPIFLSWIMAIPQWLTHILAATLFSLFLVDTIISIKIISNIRVSQKGIRQDSTEEITKQVKEILSSKSVLNRRLVHAYPNLQARVKKLHRKLTKKKEKENTKEDK